MDLVGFKEIVDFDGSIKHDLSKPDGMPRKTSGYFKNKVHGLGAKDEFERRDKDDL